jgi:predicted lactoylglutathione lyase
MPRMIFINLPVADLDSSRRFFSRLGFSFNERFCDDDALCLVISNTIFAMLLRRDFFAGFTRLPVADGHRTTEAILGLSADSRQEVDTMVDAALAAGGSEPARPRRRGEVMYGRSFEDLDGHLWEVFWMESAVARRR